MTPRNPGRRMTRLLVVFALAACGGGSAADQAAPVVIEPAKDAIAKATENGPVKATVKVWPAKPTLGDEIYLRVEIEAAAGVTVDAPFQEAGDQRMGRFRVLGFTRDSHRNADGSQRQDQTYTLEAPSSGKHRIPPLRLEMVDGRSKQGSDASKPQELLTEEVPIEVAPVKAEAIGAELHPAVGKLDPDVGGTPWIVILVAACGALMVGSGTVLALRTLAARRKLAEQKSAYEDAVAKLRALESRGAPAAEQADEWFVELSAIVRSYLERRHQIRAPELTSEEFLLVASRSADLTAEHRGLLTSFLERCDRVKFAGYRPDADESIATLAAARAFIEDTRLREEPGKAAA
ncbi:MAG: hypothetical protein JWO36_6010 [Myxococcales bacterium]|nr:hypothetical protein [Myxococcales bacterium]